MVEIATRLTPPSDCKPLTHGPLGGPVLRSALVLLAVLLGACSSGQEATGDAPVEAESAATPAGDGAAMLAQHEGDRPDPSPLAALAPRQPVSAETVTYTTLTDSTGAEQAVQGYLARPQDQDPVAALVVIHEWWGLNDNIRAMTDRLAGEGYLALAVDLYNGATADAPEVARTLVDGVAANPAAAKTNLQGAYDYLLAQMTSLNPALAAQGTEAKVGSIGWCFGGAWSLQTALLLPTELDAAVIYYGRLETDPQVLEPLQVPILGLFGGQDKSPDPATVTAFELALQGLGKTIEVHTYPEADHAFANPSGTRYNAAAATDAWQKTVAFLQQHLQSTP